MIYYIYIRIYILWILLACLDTCCKMHLQQRYCGAVLTLAKGIFEFGHTVWRKDSSASSPEVPWQMPSTRFGNGHVTAANHIMYQVPFRGAPKCAKTTKQTKRHFRVPQSKSHIAARGFHNFQMFSNDFLALQLPVPTGTSGWSARTQTAAEGARISQAMAQTAFSSIKVAENPTATPSIARRCPLD
jgi:hypothetical protein